MKLVESIFSADRTRRVDVYEREDGTFGFEELRFGEDEQAWYPCGRHAVSFTASAGEARGEARGRVRWLSEPGGE